MGKHHFLSPEIVPPITFDWTGDVNIFLNFGDSTFVLLLIVVLVALISASKR